MNIDNANELALVFANNPVWVLFTGNVKSKSNIEITVDYAVRFTSIVTTDAQGKGAIRIDEILRSYLFPHEPADVMLTEPHYSESVPFTIKVTDASGTKTISGNALVGGTASWSVADINKITSPGNFFLTTRTRTNTILIKEREVGRLAYLNRFSKFTVSDSNGNLTEITSTPSYDIMSLSLDKIRAQYLSNYVISPVFDVRMELEGVNTSVCMIVIVPDDGNAVLEFRNSFGQMERYSVLLTEEEIKQTDKANIERWSNYTTPERYRTRGKLTKTIKAQTGYRTGDEYNFLQDLLLSDEIHLITDTRKDKVFVAATSKMKYDNTPQSVSLSIEFCEQEENYSAL